MFTTILLSLLAMPPTDHVTLPHDRVWEGRDFAKTWGMHDIAVIQAEHGDPQGAKRTLSQIGDGGEKNPAEVTGVWFCCGRPVYDHPPARSLGSWQYEPLLVARPGMAARVPAKAPPGLPSNYLAPDPRRGVVVDFVDERDSRGTRVTSRRYADGSVMIETPHAR
jgi:hypothetical protein